MASALLAMDEIGPHALFNLRAAGERVVHTEDELEV
jgi:hypothetical protein